MYDVRVLGPVEVIGPTGHAPLVGVRQRTLTGLLALRPNTTLSVARLVEGLWGEEPPRTAQRTFHSHFTRARQAFLACGIDALTTSKAGHTLTVAPSAVDAHRFGDRTARARQRMAAGDIVGAMEDLRAGLELWRGDVLQDAEPAGWALGELDRLAEARISAMEDLCDCRIRLGEHASAAADLRALLVAHPFRERVVGLLMLALYRDSRAAEALDVYQRLREHLADTLGACPSAELETLFTAILRQDASLDADRAPPILANAPVAASAPRPAELPPRVGHFTGRHAELEGLDRVPPGQVVLITGSAGMGKSSLAAEWAHRVQDKYPDGQIHLDLGGHDAAEAPAVEDVFAHVLRALGVATDRIPSTGKEQAATYRSLLHGRRVLLFLDNARGAEQILPLIPAQEQSLCLATSRQELPELTVRHAVHLVELAPLGHADSLALLRNILGHGRLQREPAAADELVTLCAGLPLALRIVAARLATRANLSIAGVVADLRAHRLDMLSAEDGSDSIRSAFASAYGALTAGAARTFRLLGLHPGPTVGSHLAAAITGTSPEEANRNLDELTAAHLAMQTDRSRYRFHDLIRLYARERAQVEESQQICRDASQRLFDWYLGMSAAADEVLGPALRRIQVRPHHDPATIPFANKASAVLSFLDDERSNLAPVVTHATEHGRHVAAWQITFLLRRFYDLRGEWDRPQLCRAAIEAARALRDPFAEGIIRNLTGMNEISRRRFAQALEQLELAVSLTFESGDEQTRARAYNNMAVAFGKLGHHVAAVSSLRSALEIFQAQELGFDIALAHCNLAHLHTEAGRADTALAHLDQASAFASGTRNQRISALVAHNRGEALRSLGDQAAARAHFEEARMHRLALGDKWGETHALKELALIDLDLGALSAALNGFRCLAQLCREVGNQHMEAVALGHLCQVYLHKRDLVAAGRHLQAALGLRQRVPDPEHEAQLRELKAVLDLRRGHGSSTAVRAVSSG